MRSQKRLTKIETLLTPKQIVLLWLKELEPLDAQSLLETIGKDEMHEAPRNRIPNEAAKAVRDSLTRKGVKAEFIAEAALDAWKQADFLVVLALRVRQDVPLYHYREIPYFVLLTEKFQWMMEEIKRHREYDDGAWDRWRTLLAATLARVWRLRAIVAVIRKEYFDNRRLLFQEDASRLDHSIGAMENLAKRYNALRKILPSWTAIDLAALKSSAEEVVPTEVDEQVANAKAETLRASGDWKAAWELEEPYALAKIARLHSLRVICTQQGCHHDD